MISGCVELTLILEPKFAARLMTVFEFVISWSSRVLSVTSMVPPLSW